MDTSNNQNVTYLTYSPSEGVRPPPGLTAHQERLNGTVRREIPGPLSIPTSPMALIKQNAKREGEQTGVPIDQSLNDRPFVATFIVPGEPRSVRGVIEAVYSDLKVGNNNAKIVLFDTTSAPYIRVEAPTEEDALALIHTAQRLTTGHLSGLSTVTTAIFIEPPPTGSNFHISMKAIDVINGARPVLEMLPGRLKGSWDSYYDRYAYQFSENLCEALERASSLHTSLILRIHLGYYIWTRYKKGSLTMEEFENMVKSPRTTGELATSLGKSPSAGGLTVETALSLIQEAHSLCVPMDNQTSKSADVTPTYVLECWHEEDRYETDLDVIGQSSTNGQVKYTLGRTKFIPQGAQAPMFETISIGIGG